MQGGLPRAWARLRKEDQDFRVSPGYTGRNSQSPNGAKVTGTEVPCRANSDSAENGLPSAWGSGFLRKAKKRPAETTKTCFAAPSTVGVHAGKAAHQVDGLSPLLRCVITPRFTPKPFLREGFDWHLMDHVIGQILFGKESKTQRSKTQKFK